MNKMIQKIQLILDSMDMVTLLKISVDDNEKEYRVKDIEGRNGRKTNKSMYLSC